MPCRHVNNKNVPTKNLNICRKSNSRYNHGILLKGGQMAGGKNNTTIHVASCLLIPGKTFKIQNIAKQTNYHRDIGRGRGGDERPRVVIMG